jgi:hypothetical protein
MTRPTPPSITRICEYRMTSTVHEMIFHVATARAVDMFLMYLDSALERHDGYSPLPLLVTLPEDDLPPVLPFMAQLQIWEQSHHTLPRMTTALLYSDNMLPALVATTGNMLFRRRSGDVCRSFPIWQQEQALRWLYQQTLMQMR